MARGICFYRHRDAGDGDKMAVDARRVAHGDPPRAVYVYAPSAAEGASDGPVTLIMGRSRQFGVNILVTAYYEEHLEAGDEILSSAGSGSGGSSTSRRTA